MARKLIDLTGQRFGRLTVEKRWGSYEDDGGHTIPTWLCICDCGRKSIVLGSALKQKNTQSCGCLRRETAPQNRRRYCMERRLYNV